MKQNDLLLLIISCFVLVLIWIGLNLYHAHADSTITETQNIQVIPISPHFNRGAIEALKSREKVDPLYENTAPIIASSSPQPSQGLLVTPTKTSSASASKVTTR